MRTLAVIKKRVLSVVAERRDLTFDMGAPSKKFPGPIRFCVPGPGEPTSQASSGRKPVSNNYEFDISSCVP
jgi:hypothetical protein